MKLNEISHLDKVEPVKTLYLLKENIYESEEELYNDLNIVMNKYMEYENKVRERLSLDIHDGKSIIKIYNDIKVDIYALEEIFNHYERIDYCNNYLGKNDVFIISKYYLENNEFVLKKVDIKSIGCDTDHFSFIDRIEDKIFWNSEIGSIRYLYDLFDNYNVVYNKNPYKEEDEFFKNLDSYIEDREKIKIMR